MEHLESSLLGHAWKFGIYSFKPSYPGVGPLGFFLEREKIFKSFYLLPFLPLYWSIRLIYIHNKSSKLAEMLLEFKIVACKIFDFFGATLRYLFAFNFCLYVISFCLLSQVSIKLMNVLLCYYILQSDLQSCHTTYQLITLQLIIRENFTITYHNIFWTGNGVKEVFFLSLDGGQLIYCVFRL